MKRHFLNQTDLSNKFWQLETAGARLLVRFGKAGTAGQRQEKNFDSTEACDKEAQKLIAEKLRKGYVEVAVDAPIPDKEPTNPIVLRLAYWLRLGLTTRQQILDQLELEVYEGGLDDSDDFDVFQFLDDKFEGDEQRFSNWLKLQFTEQLKRQREREQSFPSPTDFDKLAQAFYLLRQQGIVAVHNTTDTYSGGREIVGSRREPNSLGYCFYHQQRLREIYQPFNLHLYFGAFLGSNDLNEAADAVIGSTVVAALRAQGLTVHWEGNADSSIEVVAINWQKRFDDTNWTASDLLPAVPAPA